MAAATTTVPYERFATTFREEHRIIRDLLLNLVDAYAELDARRAGSLLAEVAQVTGPHFRYEEESLYPALVPVFGPEYIEKLLADHDFAIASARRLVELTDDGALDSAAAAEAVQLTRGILPHVSDCEGLTIMAELFSDADLDSVLEARAAAREAGLDLLTWAAEVRPRPA